jgi:putative aldouronate transport system permease protein
MVDSAERIIEQTAPSVPHRVRQSRGDFIFSAVNYSILSIIFLVVLYPLVYVVSNSFSSTNAVISGRVWLLPVEPSLQGYRAVFEHKHIWTGYANAAFYMIFGTAINIFLTILAAYPLSRRDFSGRNIVMALFTFTILFNGGLIPTYLLVRSLGMLDTRWAMLIPNAIIVFNVIVTRTYFQTTIPDELLEASQLDGCSDFRFVTSVVIPLSGPILAVITLWYAVTHWNSYFWALIFLKSSRLYPLQIVLRNILIMNQVSADMLMDVELTEALEGMVELLKFSLIVVASVPVLSIYPFVQKYFVRGIMIGSIKG